MVSNSNQKEHKYFSDIIGDSYKEWINTKIILDGGTGTGKTYFVLNILGKYAKSQKKTILYLCNRSKLRKQVYDQIGELKLRGTVYVTSYQALQKKIQKNEVISQYDYIISDECHYFTTDARFNDYTDIAYNFVMGQQVSTVLLISATAKSFFQNLINSGKVESRNYYKLDKDYSYVKKLYYYKKDELRGIIDDILGNEQESKIIVFCNSGDRIIEMNKIYGDRACYYCSKNTKSEKLKRLCGWKEKKAPSCIKRYSENLITFDKRILFTTSVLDNGVDLKDRNIKHIITELVDIDTMIQSLGRKRSLDVTDHCTFYIRLYQKKGLQGFINGVKKQLDPVNLFKNNYAEFYEEYGNGKKRRVINKNEIFYNFFGKENTFASIKINECKYRKYSQDYEMFTCMKEMGHKEYLEEILEEALIKDAEEVVCNVEELDMFIQFLKTIENKRLYATDQFFIKSEFESVGLKLRYKGINTFNGALDDIYKDIYKCRFYNSTTEGKAYIDKRRKLENGLDNPNRDKRYWILEERKVG